MINFFKTWCEGIVVAVVIGVIIESFIPDGNNKKYIKVVIGIYILFVILNPIIENLDKDINTNEFINFETTETVSNIDSNIKDVYINGLEENLKQEIEEIGYRVSKVKITVDKNYENIEKIELVIKKNEISEIEQIRIGKSVDSNYSVDFIDLINYISTNYKIDTSKINIKIFS